MSEQKTGKKLKIIRNSILEKNKKKGKIGFTGYKVNLVQLYNIDEDPTEKNDVSSEFPKVVNVMLTKLADYYVRLCILYHFMDNLIGPNISTGPFSDVLVRNSMIRFAV